MAFRPTSDSEAAHAITRLVDGTLSQSERDDVEAWVTQNPELERQVAVQREVARGLATGGPPTPDRLIKAVELRARDRSDRKRSRLFESRPLTGSWLGWRSVAALAVVAALVVALVAIFGTSGSSASPSITAAAKLAFAPATQAAPGVSSPAYLDVSYGGVTFPNYATLSAIPTGRLENRIGDRPALTVFYRLRDGARLSYTVFSGNAVALPSAAKPVRFEGVPLHFYRTSDGLSVVTLVRYGRTCVLAAPAPEDTVLGLAAKPVLAQRT